MTVGDLLSNLTLLMEMMITSNRTVSIKDALIYKKIKGFGKLTLGNQKVAAGLYENTSSNNLIFMERPMHNETMNFGHRAGFGYDTSGH